MTYSDMIAKIMPEVQSGGDEPFLIFHDADGGWRAEFTRDKYGSTYGWVDIEMERDKEAFVTRGQDFADGSMAYVHDKVLCQRMRNEYYNGFRYDTDAEQKKVHALLNFFEDNVTEFSAKTVDYLTEVERPLAFLKEICPYNLATSHEGWTFNEGLAWDAIDVIQTKAEELADSHYEAELNKQTQREAKALLESREISGKPKRVIGGHYTERFSVALAGREVFLAVDKTDDAPYLVCTAKWDNPLGVTEYLDGAVSADYLEAMREFVDRVDGLLITLEQERAAFPTIQPKLTAADCIPNRFDESLTGKLVVIKPEVLSSEYQTADHQLKIVQGGFGANTDARGKAVFCKDLYSGKETRFERYDIAGVIDPVKLPEWAKKKLAEQCGDLLPLKQKSASAASKPEKPKMATKKPSILDELEAAKATAAVQNAERKGGNPAKKRGDMEVD
jgi:hypothetical protein